MWGYLAKRTVQMILTLFLFQALTYAIIDAQPGDIADLLTLDPNIPPNERERLRRELGLDRPPAERFITYIGNFYRGDLGVSFAEYPKPVIDIIRERLPRTLVLFVSASIVSFVAGFFTGRILAWKRGGVVEYGSTIMGVILYTMFLPFFALMMIWLFAVTLDWLPTGKFLNPLLWLETEVAANDVFMALILTALIVGTVAAIGFVVSNHVERRYRSWIRVASVVTPLIASLIYWSTSGIGFLAWDIFSHLILPVMVLTLYTYGGTMLLMRTSMLETMREDFILTAKAKGLPDKVVRDRHAARTALLPVWTGLVFAIGGALAGGIITETIFSWPGLGRTLLNSALVADIPVAMGVLTVIGVMTLLSHLVADVGYAFLDPRIRYS